MSGKCWKIRAEIAPVIPVCFALRRFEISRFKILRKIRRKCHEEKRFDYLIWIQYDINIRRKISSLFLYIFLFDDRSNHSPWRHFSLTPCKQSPWQFRFFSDNISAFKFEKTGSDTNELLNSRRNIPAIDENYHKLLMTCSSNGFVTELFSRSLGFATRRSV